MIFTFNIQYVHFTLINILHKQGETLIGDFAFTQSFIKTSTAFVHFLHFLKYIEVLQAKNKIQIRSVQHGIIVNCNHDSNQK